MAVDQLERQLDSAADSLEASYDALKAGAQEALDADSPAAFLQALAKLAPDFQNLLNQVTTTVGDLQSASIAEDAAAELEQAFQDAESCQQLTTED